MQKQIGSKAPRTNYLFSRYFFDTALRVIKVSGFYFYMDRIYHRYENWECFKSGMYDNKDSDELQKLAVDILTNRIQFLKTGLTVVKEWKKTCEHHLSNDSSNKQAFIGQICCSFKYSVPETSTRKAWALLSEMQKEQANKIADLIISRFKHEKKNKQLRFRLGA